jgi:hypothetical protein
LQVKKLDLLFNPCLPLDEFRKPDATAAAPVPNHDKAILFIQMQLCERTLRAWLDERNENVQKKSDPGK